MDCTFNTEEGKFNLRVGAVITDGKRVLVTDYGSAVDFYTVIGGRVHFGETAEAAIVREIQEELGVKAEIDRLYSLEEKFFRVGETVYHEIEFLFLIKPFDITKIDYDAIHCDGENSNIVWLDLDKTPDRPVFPRHLFKAAADPDEGVQFIVRNEL